MITTSAASHSAALSALQQNAECKVLTARHRKDVNFGWCSIFALLSATIPSEIQTKGDRMPKDSSSTSNVPFLH